MRPHHVSPVTVGALTVNCEETSPACNLSQWWHHFAVVDAFVTASGVQYDKSLIWEENISTSLQLLLHSSLVVNVEPLDRWLWATATRAEELGSSGGRNTDVWWLGPEEWWLCVREQTHTWNSL